MTMLNDCPLFYVKMNPARPNTRFPGTPSWEVQLRTTVVAQKREWEAQGIKVRAVVPNDDPAQLYYACNIRRKIKKVDGTPATPPTCVNGQLEAIDPDTVGNESIGNVRIFQYDYPAGTDSDGKATPAGKATILMGVQVTTHRMYTAKPKQDEFKTTATHVIPEPDDNEPGFVPTTTTVETVAPTVPSAPAAPSGDY